MACFSRITRTHMKDAKRIASSLTGLGYEVTVEGDTITGRSANGSLTFARARGAEEFETATYDTQALNAVQRKYSEIGVREWARRKGISITSVENEGRKLTLQNRRG